MTNANATEIVVVLDRSGSMQRIRSDMEGAFDHFIAEQRLGPGECHVTLTRFDDTFESVYVHKPIAEVAKLELIPRGGTALWDALGKTIGLVGGRFASLPEHERPGRVVVLVITDGFENQSKEWDAARLRAAVEHQEKKYGWQFIYLGCTPGAALEAGEIGIKNMANYTASAAGVRGLGGAVGQAVNSYRSALRSSGGVVAMDWSAALPKNIPEAQDPAPGKK